MQIDDKTIEKLLQKEIKEQVKNKLSGYNKNKIKQIVEEYIYDCVSNYLNSEEILELIKTTIVNNNKEELQKQLLDKISKGFINAIKYAFYEEDNEIDYYDD